MDGLGDCIMLSIISVNTACHRELQVYSESYTFRVPLWSPHRVGEDRVIPRPRLEITSRDFKIILTNKVVKFIH